MKKTSQTTQTSVLLKSKSSSTFSCTRIYTAAICTVIMVISTVIMVVSSVIMVISTVIMVIMVISTVIMVITAMGQLFVQLQINLKMKN